MKQTHLAISSSKNKTSKFPSNHPKVADMRQTRTLEEQDKPQRHGPTPGS